MKTTARERTAYHEAGHAVAAYALHLRFHYITIKPDPDRDSAGHMLSVLNKNMALWEMSDGWPQRYRARLERQAMISLAGAVGQELITGKPEWRRRAASDLEAALDMLEPLSGNLDEAVKYREWLTVRIRNGLAAKHYRRSIEALGCSLLISETINYPVARTIIQKAIPVTPLKIPFNRALTEAQDFVKGLKKQAGKCL